MANLLQSRHHLPLIILAILPFASAAVGLPTPEEAAIESNAPGVVAPQIKPNRGLRYPAEALRKRQTGTVVVRSLIDADGSVRQVELLETSGSEHLDSAALNAAAGWSYEPAMLDGLPIAVWHAHPIKFNIDW